MSTRTSQAWLTERVALLGELQLLEGTHLQDVGNGWLARWHDNGDTLELIDASTVTWPTFPLTVPPNLRPAEPQDRNRRSKDGTSLIWQLTSRSEAGAKLLDLTGARVIHRVGEGIREWGPNDPKLGQWGARRSNRRFTSRESEPDGWGISAVSLSQDGQQVTIWREAWWTDINTTRQGPREIWDLSGSTPTLLTTVPEAPNQQSDEKSRQAGQENESSRVREERLTFGLLDGQIVAIPESLFHQSRMA